MTDMGGRDRLMGLRARTLPRVGLGSWKWQEVTESRAG